MKSRDDRSARSLVSLVEAQWLTAPDALVLCGLPFLTCAEVLVLADGVDRRTRRAVASSHVELWRALVKSAFPGTPFSPCKAPSPRSETPSALPDSARLATWKDVFRLMATQESSLLFPRGDANGGSQLRIQTASRPELVPVQLDPDQQQRLRVKLGGKTLLLLDVSPSSKRSKDSWVLLRERVQVTRSQARDASVTAPSTTDRFRTMRHKLSTMSFGKEKDAPALPDSSSSRENYPSTGTIVLTGMHILVQSPVFSDMVARIGDVKVVYTADASSSFTLETSSACFLISLKTSESAVAWVTAIASLILRAPVGGDSPPLQSLATAAAANSPQKPDSRGRLSAKWRAAQLPRIRSITCPGPSSTSSSLFPRPLKTTKSAPVLDAVARSSGGSFASAFTKANRLFKSLSFTESPSSSRFVTSTPAFLQQPRFASTRRAFPRPPTTFSDRNSTGALALVKPRRSKVLKRASMASSSSNENSLAADEDQQQQASKPLEEHHHNDNNNKSRVVKAPGTLDTLDATSRHVRRVVFSLLRSSETFEGHVASRFFERQQQQFLADSTCPATCRSYLNKVRDCIQDLVQFILSFRLKQLQKCLKSDQEPQYDDDSTATTCENNSQHVKHTGGYIQVPQELGPLVQDAVEAYFFSSTSRSSSLSARVTTWCSVVATVPRTATFERKLVQWGTLPADSDEFALSNPRHVESSPSVHRAIGSLRAMSDEVAPSCKLRRFMDAVCALNDHTAVESPATGANTTVCDADELLPLLIFAICKSCVSRPLVQCVAMQQLCAFSSPHGERVYYLTMFETALEFVRTHTRDS